MKHSFVKVLIYSTLFLWAEIIITTSASSLVIPPGVSKICGENSNERISIVQEKALVGIMIQPHQKRFGMYNANISKATILDEACGCGYILDVDGSSPIQDTILSINISNVIDKQIGDHFKFDSPQSLTQTDLSHAIELIDPNALKEIKDLDGHRNFFEKVVQYFDLMVQPIETGSLSTINLDIPCWSKWDGGLIGIRDILKSIGSVFEPIVDRPRSLEPAPRIAFITAAAGASLFFTGANTMMSFYNLVKNPIASTKSCSCGCSCKVCNCGCSCSFRDLFNDQLKIGLDGGIVEGKNKIFCILAEVNSYSNLSIESFVASITNMTTSLFSDISRPNLTDLAVQVDAAIEMFNDEIAKEHADPKKYSDFLEFVHGMRGEGNYRAGGIEIAPVVKVLTNTSSSTKEAIMNLFHVTSPVIPLQRSMPALLVHMLKSLKTTDGQSYIKKLIPDLKIPKEGVQNIGLRSNGDDGSETLLPPEELKQLPVVKDVYNELDSMTKAHYDASLDTFLDPE